MVMRTIVGFPPLLAAVGAWGLALGGESSPSQKSNNQGQIDRLSSSIKGNEISPEINELLTAIAKLEVQAESANLGIYKYLWNHRWAKTKIGEGREAILEHCDKQNGLDSTVRQLRKEYEDTQTYLRDLLGQVVKDGQRRKAAEEKEKKDLEAQQGSSWGARAVEGAVGAGVAALAFGAYLFFSSSS